MSNQELRKLFVTENGHHLSFRTVGRVIMAIRVSEEKPIKIQNG